MRQLTGCNLIFTVYVPGNRPLGEKAEDAMYHVFDNLFDLVNKAFLIELRKLSMMQSPPRGSEHFDMWSEPLEVFDDEPVECDFANMSFNIWVNVENRNLIFPNWQKTPEVSYLWAAFTSAVAKVAKSSRKKIHPKGMSMYLSYQQSNTTDLFNPNEPASVDCAMKKHWKVIRSEKG